jgi:hypothetical protein
MPDLSPNQDYTPPIPDCILPGEPVRADVGKAYRRGFYQGAAILLRHLQEGASVPELQRWVMQLLAWRGKTSGWTADQSVEPVRPPVGPRAEPTTKGN